EDGIRDLTVTGVQTCALPIFIATIIFFNVFAPVYVLTASAQGAPAYDFKVVIGEVYQNAFVFYRMGYAGAQSVVLLLFVLTLVRSEERRVGKEWRLGGSRDR